MRVFSLARRFLRRPFREQWVFPEAVWQLWRAERRVKHLSFGDLKRQLEAQPPLPTCADASGDQVGLVGRVVRAAARSLPWEAACLAQALAARAMLRRRGIDACLHIGVAHPLDAREGVDSHAWLTVGPLVVTGAAGRARFREIVTVGPQPAD